MKEYVLIEFVVDNIDDAILLSSKILNLGKDFILINDVNDSEYEIDEDNNLTTFWRTTGRISSEYASVIKLQDPFLADRMRISYISEELKNKYRS